MSNGGTRRRRYLVRTYPMCVDDILSKYKLDYSTFTRAHAHNLIVSFRSFRFRKLSLEIFVSSSSREQLWFSGNARNDDPIPHWFTDSKRIWRKGGEKNDVLTLLLSITNPRENDHEFMGFLLEIWKIYFIFTNISLRSNSQSYVIGVAGNKFDNLIILIKFIRYIFVVCCTL